MEAMINASRPNLARWGKSQRGETERQRERGRGRENVPKITGGW
jgi:hypothetical protein